jgi:4-hydroxybenzoate polyprenyltransferase
MPTRAPEQVAVPLPEEHHGPAAWSPRRYGMLIEAMRPKQWTKNLFVLAGAVFSGRALEADVELRAWSTFVAFCAISSATYLINDLRDKDFDRLSERTAGRPIARGDIGPRTTVVAALVCALVAVAIAAAINWQTLAVLGGYAAMQALYIVWFKHMLFLDVMTIAAGFLLRTVAGIVCIGAVYSPWLLLATGLLALFIGLAKRRGELVALADATHTSRPVLDHYSLALVDELISVVTPCIVMVYALYAVLGAPSDVMLATLPFVIYGIFRVLFLMHHGGKVTEDPSLLAIRDRPLMICIALWAVASGVVTAVSY